MFAQHSTAQHCDHATPSCTVVASLAMISLSTPPSPTSHHFFETLTSSSPSHLWSSNRRCFPQKCPLQKPQSPMIRCAPSRQSLNVHRCFLGGMPPRIGRARCKVDSRVMRCDSRVEDGERCFPAYTRRRSCEGREVRMERRVVRLETVRSCGTVIGIAG